jgi:hypothetical protein
MPKALKIILILLLFIGFFEAGLFSSYTIVTSEAPDVKGLIDLQINAISEFFNSEKVNSFLIKDPEKINVTNKIEATEKIASLAKVDGVDLDNFNVTTYSSTDDVQISVNITALGFSSPNTQTGEIVLSGTPDYTIKASAMANKTNDGFVIDLNSIKIISILKFFNQTTTSNTSSGNSTNEGIITIG